MRRANKIPSTLCFLLPALFAFAAGRGLPLFSTRASEAKNDRRYALKRRLQPEKVLVRPKSYNMFNGGSGGQAFWDDQYSRLPAKDYEWLGDGRGELTDGYKELNDSWDVNPGPYVGWERSKGYLPDVSFFFGKVVTIDEVKISVDDPLNQNGGICRPKDAIIGGKVYNFPEPTSGNLLNVFQIGDSSRGPYEAIISLDPPIISRQVRVILRNECDWVLVSEVEFHTIDTDNDGVPDNIDQCPATVADTVTDEVGEDDFIFEENDFVTKDPTSGQTVASAVYTIEKTKGCSCQQILDKTNSIEESCSSTELNEWIATTKITGTITTDQLFPTEVPTDRPFYHPSNTPSSSPTVTPGNAPKVTFPTGIPSSNPSKIPTESPTINPSRTPTRNPTPSPTKIPTESPSSSPIRNPTKSPTSNPSKTPTRNPTPSPTKIPTESPTSHPSSAPVGNPTPSPTLDCKSYCAGNTSPWEKKCNWDNCGACDECSNITPSPTSSTPCLSWCPNNTSPWEVKCGWPLKCKGCPECYTDPPSLSPSATSSPTFTPKPTPPPTKVCRGYCAGNTTPWENKCNWDNCGACDECSAITPSPTSSSPCLSWCPNNTNPWEVKCEWPLKCKGCPECNSDLNTDKQTIAPSLTPTSTRPPNSTPKPTPPPTKVCMGYCPNNTTPWEKKCNWDRCGACDECIVSAPPTSSLQCETWCPKNTNSWDTKCTYERCAGCAPCFGNTSVPTASPAFPCKPFCANNTKSWDEKCKWKDSCKGCASCTS